MNGIIVNNDHSGRNCANKTMILSAGNGLSASNTVSYAYDSIGRLGLNPSYNHLNLAGEIGAASGDQLHYTHVYDGTKLRSVIDGDTGAVVEASDYYPFGKRIPSPATESAAVFGSVSVTKPAEVTADPNPHSVASTSSATVVTATTAIRLRSRAALKSTFRDFRRLLRLIPSGMTRMKPVTGSFERRYAV